MKIILRDVWWRRITANDLFNIDKPYVTGPKGQEHIDVPNVQALHKFLGVSTPADPTKWLPYTISARALSDPTKLATLTFQPRPKNSRYHIRRQNINSATSERHPAWTSTFGWPGSTTPLTSTKEAKEVADQGLIIFLAHDVSGEVFAGFFFGMDHLNALPPEFASLNGVGSAGFINNISPESSSKFVEVFGLFSSGKKLSSRTVASRKSNHPRGENSPDKTVPIAEMQGPFIGNVDGTLPGQIFEDRSSLDASGIHALDAQDIWYIENGPAVSIISDPDHLQPEDQVGHYVYTAATSKPESNVREPASKTDGVASHRAILYSRENEVPVRLVRALTTEEASRGKYQYEGLFKITSHWFENSRSETRTLRVQLTRLQETIVEAIPPEIPKPVPGGKAKPERRKTTSSTLKRDYRVPEWVKALYDFACQICSVRLVAPNGPFAQGAHIKAIGGTHAGEDVIGNMLCLCPNCHALFDFGACYIDEDCKTVTYLDGRPSSTLHVHQDHPLDANAIEYHRLHVANVAHKAQAKKSPK